MTTKKHLKRRVRSRVAATGESYGTALRSIRRDQLEDRVSIATTTEEVIASCSFCAKPSTEVKKLVAGPGVFICNECIELSAIVIADAVNELPEQAARRRAEFVDRSAADILAQLSALARSAAQVETDLVRWVGRLREQGTDWQQIADALGTSVDAAQQRFEKRSPS
jgi:hypothetical protein